MTNNKLPSSIFSCFVNVNLIIFLYGPVDNPFFLLSLQEYVYKNMFQYVYCIRIRSGGQVTFKKQLSYFTSVTCKSNSLLLIRYPFFIVTVPLQLLVTDILNVTKALLVTTKCNQLCNGTVTSLHLSFEKKPENLTA